MPEIASFQSPAAQALAALETHSASRENVTVADPFNIPLIASMIAVPEA